MTVDPDRPDRTDVIGRMVYGDDWPKIRDRARRSRTTAVVVVIASAVITALLIGILAGIAVRVWTGTWS